MAAYFKDTPRQRLFGAVYEALYRIRDEEENLDPNSQIYSIILKTLLKNDPSCDLELLIAGLAKKITVILLTSNSKEIIRVCEKIQILVVPQKLSSDDYPGVFINENGEEFYLDDNLGPIPGKSFNLLSGRFSTEYSSTKRRRTEVYG